MLSYFCDLFVALFYCLCLLHEVYSEMYNDFIFKVYSPYSQKGLFLNWEEFWYNYQDRTKALTLKKLIKKEHKKEKLCHLRTKRKEGSEIRVFHK